ncbi:MAG: hypothetical protein P1R58_08630 [bacterium]|nr:hypothetical protein [bacterium]
MKRPTSYTILSFLPFFCAERPVAATSSAGVNLYGISHHVDKGLWFGNELNEYHPGFGLNFEFGGSRSNHWLVEGGTFKDSERRRARYVGAGFKLRLFWQVRIGMIAALYSSETLPNSNAVFAPVPILSVNLPIVTLNGVYLPKYEGINPYHIFGGYITIRFWEEK